MKIEQQEIKPQFRPIVITLETSEEAFALWDAARQARNSCSATTRRHDALVAIMDGISPLLDK